MWSHRRILAALGTALLATTLAYLGVRDPNDGAEAVETTGDSITATTSPEVSLPPDGAVTSSPSTSTAVAPSASVPTSTTIGVGSRVGSSGSRARPSTTTSTSAGPAFSAAIVPVTAVDLGVSWRPGCPVGPDQLRAVDATHWGYDGAVHTGRVIVAAGRAEGIVAVLQELFDARFPIERIEPVDRYGGDDHASMVANNTSGFNCRTVAGQDGWSEHAYGQAIDVNPLVNPYVRGETVDPPEGAEYADREPADTPGMIHAGDAAVTAFERQGWQWGGYWASGQDYQHFSTSGR